MCVILFVVKKENDEKLNELMLENISRFSTYNRDGVAMIGKINDVLKQYRTINPDYETIKSFINGQSFFGTHLRLKTTGEVSDNNCHFWQYKNWLFAHNGTAYKLGSEKICDSKAFFDELVKEKFLKGNKIEYEKIQKYIDKSSFTGRCVLFNVKNKRGYFFGDYKVFAIEKNYLAICSSDIETEKSFNLFGLDFDDETIPEFEKLEAEIDGVNMVNFDKKIIIHLADKYDGWKKNKNGTWTEVKDNNDDIDEKVLGEAGYLAYDDDLLEFEMLSPAERDAYYTEHEQKCYEAKLEQLYNSEYYRV